MNRFPAARSARPAALLLPLVVWGCGGHAPPADPVPAGAVSEAPPAPISRSAVAEREARDLVAAGAPGAGVLRIDEAGLHLGVAGERALGSGDPVMGDDRWHLGSNTKAMTAVLVARLVEAGVVAWDDSVERWLAELDPHPAFRGATFPQLLAHRSGLPANAEPAVMMALFGTDALRDPVADRRAYAAAVLASANGADQAEGTGLAAGGAARGGSGPGDPAPFLYSNAGYVVAGAMLEAATGEAWESLIRTWVWEPLGITTGGFGPPPDGIQGHRADPEGRLSPQPLSAFADNPPALGPAGRAHMTLADYGRFLQAVLDGARGQGDPGFLSAGGWTRLLSPMEGPRAPGDPAYALGWGVLEEGRLLQHAGSNGLWFVRARLAPGEGRGVVVAVNEARVDRLGEAMDAILAGGGVAHP
jgi:D-alanyl-D-alanine carboxypeptidase